MIVLLKNSGKSGAQVTLAVGEHEVSPLYLKGGEATDIALSGKLGRGAKIDLTAVTDVPGAAGQYRERERLQKAVKVSDARCTSAGGNPDLAVSSASVGGAPGRAATGRLRLEPMATATGSISGTVTSEANGAGLDGICVSAWSQGLEHTYSTITAAGGGYVINGMSPGDYTINFGDCSGSGPGFLSEYYDNVQSWDEATLMTVGVGPVTNVDATLATGGAISGTVTAESSGAVLEDICVLAVTSDDSYSTGTSTATDGSYLLRSIPPSTEFSVFFYDCGTHGYVGEYYNDAQDLSTAARLTVTSGGTVSNINAALALGGRISGMVTGQDSGAALAGICVTAYSQDDDWASSETTQADGTYILRGLATAQYRVRFEDECDSASEYQGEFYNDKLTRESANLVSVTAPDTTASINAGLAMKGKIVGTVTAEVGGAPLAGICVDADSESDADDAVTAGDGSYSLSVDTGWYKVAFYDCNTGDYLHEYYNNSLTSEGAAMVAVTAPNTTSGVNAALARGGSLSGMVTGEAGGAPLPNMCVEAWSPTLDDGSQAGTLADGTYVVRGLRTASDYQVAFYDCNGTDYVTEVWNDKPFWDSGTALSITAPNLTPNVNAALALGSRMTGIVTAASGGAPLDDMCVTAFGGPDRDIEAGWGYTESDGTYAIAGLASGSYTVRFDDCDTGIYAGEFYDNATTRTAASAVVVSAPAPKAGVNAALAIGGTISGIVTDSVTGLALGEVCVGAVSADGNWTLGGYSDDDGTYVIEGLPTANYVVHFEDCAETSRGYVSEFYDNAFTQAAASNVAVNAPGERTGINAALGKTPSAVNPSGLFKPVEPARLLDTRTGVGVPAPTAVPAQGTIDLQVAGRGSIPSSGAGAVVLNVTVTDPKMAGFITVYPGDVAKPTASNLNFVPGQTIPNHVTVKLSGDGKVKLFNGSGGTVHIIADVAGWYAVGNATEPGAFVGVTPARILDTRTGTGAPAVAVGAQQKVRLQVAGRGGVPEGTAAAAVALNVTVTEPKGPGYITVFPGVPQPTASNLNFVAGQSIPNAVTVKVGSDGYVELFNGSGGTVHLIADVAGWFRSGAVAAPGAYTPVAPERLLDTRTTGSIGPGQMLVLPIAGRGGVPEGTAAKGVVLNVTVTDPKTAGFITAYPGPVRPNASNLNFVAGQTIPNLVTVQVGASGAIALYNGSGGTVHLIADVAGWYR